MARVITPVLFCSVDRVLKCTIPLVDAHQILKIFDNRVVWHLSSGRPGSGRRITSRTQVFLSAGVWSPGQWREIR